MDFRWILVAGWKGELFLFDSLKDLFTVNVLEFSEL
jgi:hypothetical protein